MKSLEALRALMVVSCMFAPMHCCAQHSSPDLDDGLKSIALACRSSGLNPADALRRYAETTGTSLKEVARRLLAFAAAGVSSNGDDDTGALLVERSIGLLIELEDKDVLPLLRAILSKANSPYRHVAIIGTVRLTEVGEMKTYRRICQADSGFAPVDRMILYEAVLALHQRAGLGDSEKARLLEFLKYAVLRESSLPILHFLDRRLAERDGEYRVDDQRLRILGPLRDSPAQVYQEYYRNQEAVLGVGKRGSGD